jgi:uncharacterized Zn-finger protein
MRVQSMPDCKKCGIYFSQYQNINGKTYYNGNRKNCYNCSPFKKQMNKDIIGDDIVTCSICGKIYAYEKNITGSRKKCPSCIVGCRRFYIKERAIEYKGGKCQICGYNQCHRALVFHHRDKEDKLFTISQGFSRKWEKIQEELDKCDLLCSNCHAELHDEEDNAHEFNWAPREKAKVYEKVCPFCDKKFTTKFSDAMYCSNMCGQRSKRPYTLPTKEELVELLERFNHNYTQISKLYGITSNAVKKWAVNYGIFKGGYRRK